MRPALAMIIAVISLLFAPAAVASVELTYRTPTVARGDVAMLAIRVSPRARCDISARLGDRMVGRADLRSQFGNALMWSWSNRATTPAGTWLVDVDCGGSGSLATTVVIRDFRDADCAVADCYSFVVASGSYAQLAGILAGFAFLAIITVLGIGRGWGVKLTDDERSTLTALVAAFVGLLIATFLFAAESGEEGVNPRSAALLYLASVALAPAIFLLFFGIVLLAKVHIAERSRGIEVAASTIVPTVALVFLAVTATYAMSIDRAGRSVWGWWEGAVLVVTAVAVAVLVSDCIATRKLPTRRARHWGGMKSASMCVRAGVMIPVIAAVVTAAVGALSITWSLPALVIILMQGVTAAWTVLLARVTNGISVA